MSATSVRRSLYVLFARLLAAAPDATLYARLHAGGLRHLAEAQGVDLSSDLEDADDAERSAAQLSREYARLSNSLPLRAGAYAAGAEDSRVAMEAYLREHALRLEGEVDLPPDHLAVVLGVMGELAGRADREEDSDAPVRARAFFRRFVEPWAQRVLADLAAQADLRFYRGLAAMVSAFLESERRALAG